LSKREGPVSGKKINGISPFQVDYIEFGSLGQGESSSFLKEPTRPFPDNVFYQPLEVIIISEKKKTSACFIKQYLQEKNIFNVINELKK
jgi:hypothetical protein